MDNKKQYRKCKECHLTRNIEESPECPNCKYKLKSHPLTEEVKEKIRKTQLKNQQGVMHR